MLIACAKLESPPPFLDDLPMIEPSESDVDAWRRRTLALAGEDGMECLRIGREINHPWRIYSGQFLVAQVEVLRGDREKGIATLHRLLAETEDFEEEFELHYVLWGFGEEEHRRPALDIVTRVHAETPKPKFARMIEELSHSPGTD